MTDFISLPQSIDDGQNQDDVFFCLHRSKKRILKNKITLQKNLISLLTSGEKVLHYASKTAIIDPGHFAILSAGNCLMTEKLAEDAHYVSTLIFFDNSVLNEFFVKYQRLIPAVNFENHKLQGPFAVLAKDAFITHYTESINFLLKSNTRLSIEMRRIKLEELFLHLLDKFPQVLLSLLSESQFHADDLLIQRVTEENVYRNLTLEELSFLSNSSVSTFKRRFSRIYKTSPNKYFLSRKLEQAALLLIQHRKKPSEVFYQLGYESLSSFSTSFKQFYGICPKLYQREHLSK